MFSNYSLFLIPLLVSFVIAALLLMVLIAAGRKYAVCDTRTCERHLHKQGISRLGGMALIVSFLAAIFLDKQLVISTPLLGVLFASVAILVLGVVDDFRQISWKTQLLLQLIIVVFVYIVGVRLQYVSNPFGGIFLFQDGVGYVIGLLVSIVWVVFLMNAMNWVDGIDGVSGGVTFIGALTIFFLSLRPEVNQPPVGIIAAVLIGSLVAFILFNFHPAKILAGTSGSMFMGFILAVLAIFAGAKIATTLLMLAIPIIDALWVIGERFSAGDSIFSADKRHLHFKLLELGWSPRKICLFYYGVTALVAVIALNTNALGKAVAFMLISVFMTGVFFAIRRKITLLKKVKMNLF
ncbi:MAG: Glycosyl transferase [Parcubacteria group bacterium GW2011_GWD2_38_11]|nr:MAG: Glycosyl transferase [Parcubacteria group bacterium GW2011_GWD2_38_11]